VSSTVSPSPASEQAAALDELRSLGRRLDDRRPVSEDELEATLALMKQVHSGIVRSLSAHAPCS
jgi:hypothetical protein